MLSGSFFYPPPKGPNHPPFSYQDTVVANWTSIASNSTPCQISLFFLPGSGGQNWTSSGWFDVPCTGTRASPLNIRNKPYTGQFNINFTDTDGHSALYLSPVFTVGAPSPSDAVAKTFPAPLATTTSSASTSTSSATESNVASVSQDSQNQSGFLATIVGAAVGGAIGLLLIAGLIFYGWRRRRRMAARRTWPSSRLGILQEKSAYSSSQGGWSFEKPRGPLERWELPTEREPAELVEAEATECKSRFSM